MTATAATPALPASPGFSNAVGSPKKTPQPVTCQAVMGYQNGQRIFVGIMNAKDLISITTIDRYSSSLPPDDPNQGYQRPAERSRITKIGNHLIKNILRLEGNSGGLFPTAVILTSRTPLKFSDGQLKITQLLQTTDGQHRIEGLRYSLVEKGEAALENFPIAFVIIEISDRITEMNQFNIINGNAKSVRTDLVNSILTATAAKKGDDSISDTDRWKVVVTRVISKLDKEPKSPWFNLIAMPDEISSPKSKNGKVVRATSFMTSLRPVYNWLDQIGKFANSGGTADEAEVLFSVIEPYWEALKHVNPEAFQNAQDHVLQKTPGLFSLHKLLQGYLLGVMYQARLDWTKDNFVRFLEASPEITDHDFWHKDSNRAAAYGSMKGFDDLYELLVESIRPKS
jgi:DGQHR domain-containing protein